MGTEVHTIVDDLEDGLIVVAVVALVLGIARVI